MPDGPLHESQATTYYSLSAEDFKKTPSGVIPFKEGDKVTRDNFIPFLVHSFSISRGVAEGQRTYTEWVETNYGFDVITAIEHFHEAGGETLLTQQEKKFIVGAFTRVRAHNAEDEKDYPLDAFINSVLNLYQYPTLKIGNLRGAPLLTVVEGIREEYTKRHNRKRIA